MNVVVAGLGQVGLTVARHLAADGHALTVLDSDPAAVARAEEQLDALTLLASADGPQALRDCHAADADLFAALTSSGPVNVVAALRARQLGARRTVARVSEPHYFEDRRGLYPGYMGIDLVVNESYVVADEVLRLVRLAGATAIDHLAENRIESVQLRIEREGPAINRPIGDIDLGGGARIVALLRRETLLVATAADTVHVGDEVLCIGPADAMGGAVQRLTGDRNRSGGRVLIVGGGRIGLAVAEALEAASLDVILIERDAARCEALSRVLRRTQILHGEGTDIHLLEECGGAAVDIFAALSGLDEVNLMAGLLARDLGVAQAITLVQKPEYVGVCRRLGLEHTVSPRVLVANEILKGLEQGNVLRRIDVLEGTAAVLEVRVDSGRLVGRAVRELPLPRGIVLCARLAGDRVDVPDGDTVLERGDRLIAFARREAAAAFEHMLRKPMLGGGA